MGAKAGAAGAAAGVKKAAGAGAVKKAGLGASAGGLLG